MSTMTSFRTDYLYGFLEAQITASGMDGAQGQVTDTVTVVVDDVVTAFIPEDNRDVVTILLRSGWTMNLRFLSMTDTASNFYENLSRALLAR